MAVDLEAHLHDLEVQIDRLKVLYEQYFVGIEKQVPAVARREAEKLIAFLSMQSIGNTAVRFRFHGLLRRWKTYVERWDRVQREIENGTYSPHIARAKRNFGEVPSETVKKPSSSPSLREGGAPPPEGERAPAPGAVPIPGMSDGELRALHQRYVEALRTVGDVRDVKYESLVASLRKQVPELLKKNSCDVVSFSVSVKEGKVVLRATPKRVVAREGEPREGKRPDEP